MFKAIVTNAIISKGYDGADALQYSNSESSIVHFKFGYRVYDGRTESKHRYINMSAKAFGPICERIKKMGLTEGSHINIEGRIDEEKWEEGEQKRSRHVIIVDEIEYSSSGNGQSGSNESIENNVEPTTHRTQNAAPQVQPQPAQPKLQTQGSQSSGTGMPSGFGGFQSFGNINPFYPVGA